METAIVKIETTKLDEVVKDSGLQIQEADEIKKSYLPFVVQLAEAQAQSDKINFQNPGELDETIARELRLTVVKIRTTAEKVKDERKRMYLLRGNLEQASYNLIAASCKVTEEVFFNVEKARELAEKKRQAALRVERAEKICMYVESTEIYPLGIMSEKEFNDLFLGLKTTYDARVEAEKKAEEERVAKEKKDAEEREMQRLENIRLKEEADKREREIEAERQRVKAEQEEKDRLAEIERKKQAQILADQKAKADKERAELLAKAEAERKEKDRLAAEIQAKKDAEMKAKEAESKRQKEAEKKAKLAPDKEKLLNFMQAINDLPRPEVKSIEAASIAANSNTLLVKVANYIRENANKL